MGRIERLLVFAFPDKGVARGPGFVILSSVRFVNKVEAPYADMSLMLVEKA